MNAAVFLSRQETAELTVPASFTRTADRIRAGRNRNVLYGLAGSGDRGWLAQSADTSTQR